MLRYINQPKLCKGNQFVIKNITKEWDRGSDTFQFKRLQFPVRLAFTIPINKSGVNLYNYLVSIKIRISSHIVNCVSFVLGLEDKLFICMTDGKTKYNVYPQALTK